MPESKQSQPGRQGQTANPHVTCPHLVRVPTATITQGQRKQCKTIGCCRKIQCQVQETELWLPWESEISALQHMSLPRPSCTAVKALFQHEKTSQGLSEWAVQRPRLPGGELYIGGCHGESEPYSPAQKAPTHSITAPFSQSSPMASEWRAGAGSRWPVTAECLICKHCESHFASHWYPWWGHSYTTLQISPLPTIHPLYQLLNVYQHQRANNSKAETSGSIFISLEALGILL